MFYPPLKLAFSHLKHGIFGIRSRFLLGVRPIFRCELAVSFRGWDSYSSQLNPAIQTDRTIRVSDPDTGELPRLAKVSFLVSQITRSSWTYLGTVIQMFVYPLDLGTLGTLEATHVLIIVV